MRQVHRRSRLTEKRTLCLAPWAKSRLGQGHVKKSSSWQNPRVSVTSGQFLMWSSRKESATWELKADRASTGEGQQDCRGVDRASELPRELLKRNEPVARMGHNQAAFCVDQQ